MSNAQYIVQGEGPLVTVATLSADVGPLTTTFPFTGLTEVATDSRIIGMVVMVDDEICKLVSFTADSVELARGCADTTPQPHATNAVIWFMGSAVGGDSREYAATDVETVKLLPFTSSGSPVPIESSPPHELQMNFRFARPYAPGLVKIGASAWYAVTPLLKVDASGDFTLTWTHRDRVGQMDSLVDHTMGNVGPEAGTTYTVRVYDSVGTLKATYALIAGTSWSYSWTKAATDFGVVAGDAGVVNGTITLSSTRDALDSFQDYTVNFQLNKAGLTAGWGNNWGFHFGG